MRDMEVLGRAVEGGEIYIHMMKERRLCWGKSETWHGTVP
jgi:hypothetical protein